MSPNGTLELTRVTGTQAAWPDCTATEPTLNSTQSPTVTWKVMELLTVGYWMSVAQTLIWLVVVPCVAGGSPVEDAIGGDGAPAGSTGSRL